MDLISREEAINRIEEAFDMGDCYCDKFALRGILKSLPTVEERKEGHWIPYKWYFGKDKESWTDEVKCSECGELGEEEWNCCPYCTAIMKGASDEHNTGRD